MKLTKEQHQEILDQQSQKSTTKRVTSPELEKILYSFTCPRSWLYQGR